MRALWTQDAAEYHGTYYDFPTVQCNPKPAQEGGPPVILGGNARNVFRRVVRWGDGWMPTASSPEQIAAGRAAIDELAEASGRDPASINVTVFGQPADRQLIGQFEAAGANRVIVRLPSTTGDNVLQEVENIAAAVL
jgi:alkanesulfonate monooxygenase SsuD/methylene tetrahydromethanopterin reductase-like flavin-dependent oxidoreductase (luciferase family)